LFERGQKEGKERGKPFRMDAVSGKRGTNTVSLIVSYSRVGRRVLWGRGGTRLDCYKFAKGERREEIERAIEKTAQNQKNYDTGEGGGYILNID